MQQMGGFGGGGGRSGGQADLGVSIQDSHLFHTDGHAPIMSSHGSNCVFVHSHRICQTHPQTAMTSRCLTWRHDLAIAPLVCYDFLSYTIALCLHYFLLIM